MTSSDLSGAYKPWDCHFRVSIIKQRNIEVKISFGIVTK
jgi:hypothetical protein